MTEDKEGGVGLNLVNDDEEDLSEGREGPSYTEASGEHTTKREK